MTSNEKKINFIADNINTINVKKRLELVRFLKPRVKLQKTSPNGCAFFADTMDQETLDYLYAYLVKEYNDDLIDFSDIGKKREEYEAR